jgi:hypothetical protein
VQTGTDEFVVCGIGIRLKFRPVGEGDVTLVNQVLEGTIRQGKWETIRLLNGDESGSDYTADIPGRHYYTSVGKGGFSARPAWVYVPGLDELTEGGVKKQLVEAPGIYKVSVLTVRR